MALPASDTFTGSAGVDLPVYSANWAVHYGIMELNSLNEAVPLLGVSPYECCCRWQGDTFANDHYAQGVVGQISNSGGIGVTARVQTGTAGNYYGYYATDADRAMYMVSGGTWTNKGTAGGVQFVPTDVARIEASGTTITAKLNGAVDTLVGTSGAFTDSTFTTGYAGIGGWGAASSSSMTSWTADNLAEEAEPTAAYRDFETHLRPAIFAPGLAR